MNKSTPHWTELSQKREPKCIAQQTWDTPKLAYDSTMRYCTQIKRKLTIIKVNDISFGGGAVAGAGAGAGTTTGGRVSIWVILPRSPISLTRAAILLSQSLSEEKLWYSLAPKSNPSLYKMSNVNSAANRSITVRKPQQVLIRAVIRIPSIWPILVLQKQRYKGLLLLVTIFPLKAAVWWLFVLLRHTNKDKSTLFDSWRHCNLN